MFLDNFLLLFPETLSMFLVPFYFYIAQDLHDLHTKKRIIINNLERKKHFF